MNAAPLELWGGVECTVNRVGDTVFDQLALTGHGARLEDLDRFADMGFRTLRTAILWERIETAPGVRDWSHADRVMARMERLGLRPIVGLIHHGSGPRWTDLTRPDFAEGLAAHAAAVATRYPHVRDWTPVNEPLTTARFSALYGHWHPHARDESLFWLALLNQIEAVALSMRAIRGICGEGARLIQTEDFGHTGAVGACRDQAVFENRRRLMTWDLQCGTVTPDHALWPHLEALGFAGRLADLAARPSPPDIIGLNHYVTSDRLLDDRPWLYPPALRGGNGRLDYADTEAVRAQADWTPGWEACLARLHARYGLPVAVTECHLGCDPQQQIAWLADCWRAAQRARERGVEVRAVTCWALAGSVGWDRLLTVRDGSYEAGVLDASRPGAPETALADAVRALAAGHTPAGAPGWWTRPDRLRAPFAPVPDRSAPLFA